MKKLVCALALCIGMLAAGSALAAEKLKIALTTTPFGTGSYAIGSAFEAIVNKANYNFTLAHSETPGQAFNVMKLARDPSIRKNTVVATGVAINWLAERGMGPFKEKFPPLYLIGSYNVAAIWLATDNSKIKDIADLRGKKVALGRIPQIQWGYGPDALLRNGYAPDFYSSLKLQFVGTNEASTALLNGQVDACALGGNMDPETGKFSPSPQTVEILAASRPLTHLSWTKEAIDNTVAKDAPLYPYLLPKDTVTGQKEDIWTFTDTSSFCVAQEFPEEVAYQITKALIENVSNFAQYHDLGTLMTPKMLVYGWQVDRIHPGALRAYREAGLVK